MTGRVGYEGMDPEIGWTDAAFEAALTAAPGAPDELSALVGTLVMEYTDPIADDIGKHHVSTSAAVARSAAHDAAAGAAIRSAGQRTPQRRRRIARRLTFAGAFSGMWAKIALGTAALAAVGAGAAATDSLPDPIQEVFSNVAEYIGIDIPHPDNDVVLDDEGDDTGSGIDDADGNADPLSDDLPTTSVPGTDDATDDPTESDAPEADSDDTGADSGGGSARSEEVLAWNECRRQARDEGLDPETECERLAPPGHVDDNEDPKDKAPKEPKDKPPKEPKDKPSKDPKDPKDK